MPKFTVITINYNNRDQLRHTIASVVGQSFPDIEYIVIDGGSTDGSIEVIKEYEDKITFWLSEPDNGVYHAMNKGLRHAHGEWVNFMNSGDIFHSPGVIADIDRMTGDCDILFGNVVNSANGRIYGGIPAGSEVTFMTLKKEILCHQGTFYRRAIFDRHPYDESLRLISDWKVNVQAIVFDNCRVKVVDTIVADYDLTGISSTQARLHYEERCKVTAQLLPERIAKDYEHIYSKEEMPIVGLLPELKKRGRVQKIVYWFTKFILRITS